MRGDTIRKVIRKVKNILAIVFILAIAYWQVRISTSANRLRVRNRAAVV